MREIDRYKIYFGAYVIFAIIFLLRIFGGVSDAILFAGFTISSFFLVFSLEELPTANLEKVQVHYYQKSRINTYAYYISGLFIFIGFLYYIWLSILHFNTSIFILIVWPLASIAAYYINKFATRYILEEIVFDCVEQSLDGQIDYDQRAEVKNIVYALVGDYKKDNKVDNLNFPSALTKDKELLAQVVGITVDYLNGYTDKLYPQEVKQLNQANSGQQIENSSSKPEANR
jgi:hypothetical protein